MVSISTLPIGSIRIEELKRRTLLQAIIRWLMNEPEFLRRYPRVPESKVPDEAKGDLADTMRRLDDRV